MYDVIVIGGSYAGLAATLQLARARQRVLVLDAGQRRNRFAAHSHGFLGQDGQPPDVIAARGRAEVLAYPTVTWREALATEARPVPGGFAVRVGDDELRARRLVLATGVVDELPPIPGLAERWGRTVFACPYCDGHELGLGRLGVLGSSALAPMFAALVAQWAGPGQATLFLDAATPLDDAQRADLAARGIALETAAVVEATGDAPALELRLADGRRHALDGLFVHPHTRLAVPFAAQLGCALEDGPFGPAYKTDAMRETTVPGVFACGDAASPIPAISFAVADGVRAGVAAHQSLVFRRAPAPA